MSVADLSRAGTVDASSEFTCPHYAPVPGSKRCQSYHDGGTCARPDFFLCTEWEKRNRQRLPAPKTSADTTVRTDLFGTPLPEPEQKLAPARDPHPVPTAAPTPRAAANDGIDASDRLPPPGLTTEDIESFKRLNVEVCLHSDGYGDLWLVPAYTGQDRKEITPEHAAIICCVAEAFPGSQVVSFEKHPKRAAATGDGPA